MLDKNYRCRRGDARAVRTFTQIGGSFSLAVGLIALPCVAVAMGVFMFLSLSIYEMRARGLKKTQEHLQLREQFGITLHHEVRRRMEEFKSGESGDCQSFLPRALRLSGRNFPSATPKDQPLETTLDQAIDHVVVKEVAKLFASCGPHQGD